MARCVLVLAAIVAIAGEPAPSQTYTWTSFAGCAPYGNAQSNAPPYTGDGLPGSARFDNPAGLTVDASNNVYVADRFNNTIRKITPAGIVSTLAGQAGAFGTNDGIGAAASFNQPEAVAADHLGNVFVADTINNTIRKITPFGLVTTFAGSPGATGTNDGMSGSARFNQPIGLAVDSANNLFVADKFNQAIRKITPAGLVSTFAGSPGFFGTNDGTGTAALFHRPAGLAVDKSNNVYVADYLNFTVRKITPAAIVTTLAGAPGVAGTNNGTGGSARFNPPIGVAVDGSNIVYVTDFTNDVVRKITPAGVVSTWAGLLAVSGSADGTNGSARFSFPNGIALDNSTNLFVVDSGNGTIRRVSPAGVVSTWAGRVSGGTNNGVGSAAAFNGPNAVAVDTAGNVYVADQLNNTIRKITTGGIVTTLAGKPGSSGSVNGTGGGALFNGPEGVAVDGAGNVYVADQFNYLIRKITPAGVVSTLAGTAGVPGTNDATGTAAKFNRPTGVAVGPSTNIYVADAFNYTIRKITPAGVVTTFAGTRQVFGTNDGTGGAAQFYLPYSVAVDSGGNVYVADEFNYTIRKITPAAVVTTLAGTPTISGSTDSYDGQPLFNYPCSVAVDGSGNVFVGDLDNYTIRKITPSGFVTTVGGQIQFIGFADGTGLNSLFAFDTTGAAFGGAGIAVDATGNLYVADHDNNVIRKGIMTGSWTPASLGLSPPSAGQIAFGISGPTNVKVNVSVSTNLLDWQVVSTYVLESGTNYFIGPMQTQGKQFYRAQVP